MALTAIPMPSTSAEPPKNLDAAVDMDDMRIQLLDLQAEWPLPDMSARDAALASIHAFVATHLDDCVRDALRGRADGVPPAGTMLAVAVEMFWLAGIGNEVQQARSLVSDMALARLQERVAEDDSDGEEFEFRRERQR